MALLILARHGETDVIGKRLTGRITGIHLNARGREQAQAIAEKLDGAESALFSAALWNVPWKPPGRFPKNAVYPSARTVD